MKLLFKKLFCGKISRRKTREIVIVFPYNTKTNEILFIQEYINHYDKKFWKAVTGGIDKEGKTETEHAHEELSEEMGMESENLYHLHSNQRFSALVEYMPLLQKTQP